MSLAGMLCDDLALLFIMQSFQGDELGDDASNHIYETVRSEVRRAIADIQNDLESVSLIYLDLSLISLFP